MNNTGFEEQTATNALNHLTLVEVIKLPMILNNEHMNFSNLIGII